MPDPDLILTESSKRKLEDELHQLRTVKRPEITESIRVARAYGDLSENFEYHAARRSQAILNGRIAEIQAILERAEVVEDSATNEDMVGIGSIVTVRDLDSDDEWEYTIVDATSADPVNDRISYSSPVGKSLVGRTVGVTVEVEIPEGKARYEIVALRHV